MVEKACAIARRLRELEVRPYGVVRIDSSVDPGTWAADPEGNTKRIAETFREACARAADQGELLAAEGEICWGGMHSWKEMLKLLELVRPAGDSGLSRRTWRTRCSTCWALTRRATRSCRRTSTGRTTRLSSGPTGP